MENLDIIILTSVVATLFVVFFVATYKELSKAEKEGYIPRGPNAKVYGREALFVLMARLFDDERVPKKDKKTIHKAIARTISDMESDGVYFSEEAKEELKKQADEYFCSYSGLPSVTTYYTSPIRKEKTTKKEDNEEFLIGHS